MSVVKELIFPTMVLILRFAFKFGSICEHKVSRAILNMGLLCRSGPVRSRGYPESKNCFSRLKIRVTINIVMVRYSLPNIRIVIVVKILVSTLIMLTISSRRHTVALVVVEVVVVVVVGSVLCLVHSESLAELDLTVQQVIVVALLAELLLVVQVVA